MNRGYVRGTGAALPETVLDNRAVGEPVGVGDIWIRTRTGIGQRHVVADGETTSDLAVTASRRALAAAELEPSDLDLIIVATVTPDSPLPATAATVAHRLGARCGAFDLAAACAGFVYALSVAQGQVASGLARHVLVVGADALSRYVDWRDRDTCILFGDGAGAVVLSRNEGERERGVVAVHFGADGGARDALYIAAGGALRPASQDTVSEGQHTVRMRGREVYKAAVKHLSATCRQVVADAGWRVDQVDWFIPHQANLRIIDAVGRRIGLSTERSLVNIESVGNTSAASIPLALDEAVRDGRIQPGQRLLLAGLGAGLVWGSVALTW